MIPGVLVEKKGLGTFEKKKRMQLKFLSVLLMVKFPDSDNFSTFSKNIV